MEYGGVFHDINQGISRGCPLSPLIGAFLLNGLDAELEQSGLFYVRFMDDILVLAPTRWKLRRAVRLVNRAFRKLKLEKHPDKTFIGRLKKGFDFLGYHFTCQGLRLADSTVEQFVSRANRLYEQQPTTPEGAVRLGEYVVRWLHWTTAGIGGIPLSGNDTLTLSGYEAKTCHGGAE